MRQPTQDKLADIIIPAAKEELLPRFGVCDFSHKDDGSIVTQADTDMQSRLQSQLQDHWPDIPVLGEEMEEEEQQQIIDGSERYWCIDPLDGTNNFASGLPFFAVSVALIVEGEQTIGAIYDPVRDELFYAEKNRGSRLNGNPIEPCVPSVNADSVIAEIDMKRLPTELSVRLVTEEPFSSQRNIGSSALDWCWLAAGRYNIYLHGGQKLWDYSAGNLILRETGGCSVSLDGEPVFRGRLEVRSALASLDQSLFERWKTWISIPVE